MFERDVASVNLWRCGAGSSRWIATLTPSLLSWSLLFLFAQG
jgi:hypothetical protein